MLLPLIVQVDQILDPGHAHVRYLVHVVVPFLDVVQTGLRRVKVVRGKRLVIPEGLVDVVDALCRFHHRLGCVDPGWIVVGEIFDVLEVLVGVF